MIDFCQQCGAKAELHKGEDGLHRCLGCHNLFCPGPWDVELGTSGRYWYVVNKTTGRQKRIGPVKLLRPGEGRGLAA